MHITKIINVITNDTLAKTFLLSTFIAFLARIKAGTANIYENITFLNANGIEVNEIKIEIIQNIFDFSLLIFIIFAMFIVNTKSITPIVPLISE